MNGFVALDFASRIAAVSAALVAQGIPRGPAKVVEEAPKRGELSVMLDLHASPSRRAGVFESLADVTIWMRLQNHSRGPLLLATDEASREWIATPDLVWLELFRDDGTPLDPPRFDVGYFRGHESGDAAVFDRVPVRWLGAEQTFDWSIPLRDVPGWQSIELAPGAYRVRATYRGPPDLSSVKYADPGAAAAWRGAAVSQTLPFEINGSTPQVEWSEPQSGLRIAPLPDPRGDRCFHGEPIPMVFLVENVSEAPIEFTRDVGGSQDDDVRISDAAGAELGLGKMIGTGVTARTRLTLSPHARVRLYARPVTFDLEQTIAGNSFGRGAFSGDYRIRHSLRIDGDDSTSVLRTRLDVPVRTIHLLARR